MVWFVVMGILLNGRGEEGTRGIPDECYAMFCPTLGDTVRSKSFFFDDLEGAISFVIEFFGWSFGTDVGCF